MGNTAHFLDGLASGIRDLIELPRAFLRVAGAVQPQLRATFDDLQRLAKAVVKFGSDAFALLFLGFNQASGKQLLLRSRPLVFLDANFVYAEHNPRQTS